MTIVVKSLKSAPIGIVKIGIMRYAKFMEKSVESDFREKSFNAKAQKSNIEK